MRAIFFLHLLWMVACIFPFGHESQLGPVIAPGTRIDANKLVADCQTFCVLIYKFSGFWGAQLHIQTTDNKDHLLNMLACMCRDTHKPEWLTRNRQIALDGPFYLNCGMNRRRDYTPFTNVLGQEEMLGICPKRPANEQQVMVDRVDPVNSWPTLTRAPGIGSEEDTWVHFIEQHAINIGAFLKKVRDWKYPETGKDFWGKRTICWDAQWDGHSIPFIYESISV